MLFTTILLFSIIEYFLIIRFNIKINNYILSKFFEALLSIPIYLLLFLPLYYKFGEVMFISISLMLIVIIIVAFINYKLISLKGFKSSNIIGIILIIITYIVFGYLTYKPIKTHLFFDTENEKYGINIYNI